MMDQHIKQIDAYIYRRKKKKKTKGIIIMKKSHQYHHLSKYTNTRNENEMLISMVTFHNFFISSFIIYQTFPVLSHRKSIDRFDLLLSMDTDIFSEYTLPHLAAIVSYIVNGALLRR